MYLPSRDAAGAGRTRTRPRTAPPPRWPSRGPGRRQAGRDTSRRAFSHLLVRSRERPVVLLDERAELFWHAVAARQDDAGVRRIHLPPQIELESLQALSDERLQPLQLRHILIDARVL